MFWSNYLHSERPITSPDPWTTRNGLYYKGVCRNRDQRLSNRPISRLNRLLLVQVSEASPIFSVLSTVALSTVSTCNSVYLQILAGVVPRVAGILSARVRDDVSRSHITLFRDQNSADYHRAPQTPRETQYRKLTSRQDSQHRQILSMKKKRIRSQSPWQRPACTHTFATRSHPAPGFSLP
jgi:hypothetical protein